MNITKNKKIFNLRTTLKVVLFMSIFILSNTISRANNDYLKPDFNFPQLVVSESSRQLDNSLDNKNYIEALRSALNLSIARTLINPDDIDKNISLMDSIRKISPSPYSQIAALIEADMLTEYYVAYKHILLSRKLPVTQSDNKKISEWSGEMFADKVYYLIKEALTKKEGENFFNENSYTFGLEYLLDYNNNLYKKIVDLEKSLSVEDFIQLKSASILSNFVTQSNNKILPFYSDTTQINNILEKAENETNKIYNELINRGLNSGNSVLSAFAFSKLFELNRENVNLSVLNDAINKLKGKEGLGLLLNQLYTDNFYELLNLKDFYDICLDFVQNNSNNVFTYSLNSIIETISRPFLSINVPDFLVPEKEINSTAVLSNLNKGYILIFKVDEKLLDKNLNININKFVLKNPRAVIPIETFDPVPFEKTVDWQIPSLTEGFYIAIPSDAPQLAADWRNKIERWSLHVLNVSAISAFTLNNPENQHQNFLFVVQSTNQKPVKGAKINIYSNNNLSKKIHSGVTDNNGFFEIPSNAGLIEINKENSKICIHASHYFEQSKITTHPEIDIFTDLSLYRPGDTVNFSSICWEKELNGTGKILADKDLVFILRDANYNKIDSLELTTDDSGRTSGDFLLPSDLLLGRYIIEANLKEKIKINNNSNNRFKAVSGNHGLVSFEVAEYKLPGFLVNIEQTTNPNELKKGQSINFKGNVQTFSGMPVMNATIDYTIQFIPYFYKSYYNNHNASYSSSLMCNEDGNFFISLPLENLKNTPYSSGKFRVFVRATSKDGETQEAEPITFFLGESFSIDPLFSEKIKINSDSLSLKIQVYNQEGLTVKKDVNYSIIFNDTIIKSGVFESPELNILSSDLPSGRYRVDFELPNDSIKISKTIDIYRETDHKPPFPTPLWVTENSIIVKEDQTEAEIIFGTGFPDSWIFYSVKEGEQEIYTDWVYLNDQNSKIKVKTPKGYETCSVLFSGMKDFDLEQQEVVLTNEFAHRQLKIKKETFRDKILAGSGETINFKITSDYPVEFPINVMAVMTDKSLNQITPFKWYFHPNLGLPFSPLFLNSLYNNSRATQAYFKNYKDRLQFFNLLPDWLTYGQNFIGRFNFGYTNLNKKFSLRQVITESISDDSYATAEEAPMVITGSLKEEESSKDFSLHNQQLTLRDSEYPVAFFKPYLTTDNYGDIEIKFDVPNFNTSWQLQILGYNKEMLSVLGEYDLTSYKPIMVKCNYPKFLRTGDNAEIVATIFNSSDSSLNITGKIEIINPLTGTIIKEIIENHEIKQLESHIIKGSFDVGDTLSEIEIRIYGLTEEFSDGERNLIPVYPAYSPVTEAFQIYLGTGKTNKTLKIPKLDSKANVTFKYFVDPYWQLMLSLYPLSVPESNSSLIISKALYAAVINSNIVKNYPVISDRLKTFVNNDNSKPLVSTLEEDSNLKITELDQTPWVNNAANERQRFVQLKNLLNESEVKSTIESLSSQLLKLQNSNGGWSWFENTQSSEFITREILLELGEINRTFPLPDNLQKAVNKAIIYCDNEIIKDFKKYGIISKEILLEYLYIRSFFTNIKGSGNFKNIAQSFLEELSENWDGMNIRQKAEAAIVLYRETDYKNTVSKILDSLEQFLIKDDSQGWYFANLESGFGGWERILATSMSLNAFSEIHPDSEVVEGLTQWLLMQKETEEWGNNNLSIKVIQSILSSGMKPVYLIKLPLVTIGNEKLDISSFQEEPVITINLDSKNISGKNLTIEKSSEAPAYGGVVSQYIAKMTTIKETACDNLRIKKQIIKIDDKSGDIVESETLKPGDKIRITLTVSCLKDMDYIVIKDERSACMQPKEWISGYTKTGDSYGFMEIRDNLTSMFFEFLPKGTHVFSYDCYIDRNGDYSSGIATIQSLYSPQQTAHSSGSVLKIR